MSSSFMYKSSSAKQSDPSFGRSRFSPYENRTYKARISNIFNWVWNKAIFLKGKFKGLLWIGSTAFIFLAVPIAFTILLESEHELERLQRATDSKIGCFV
jgi:hypothetical protein